MRTPKKISFSLTTEFKQQLLNWANQFEEVVWLDSNSYEFSSVEYEAILAVEAFTALKTDYVNAFDKLQEYQQTTKDWIFGYLTYDLKNDVEALSSKNFDGLSFPDLYFFQPKKIFLLKKDEVEMHYLGMVDDEMEEEMGDDEMEKMKEEEEDEETPDDDDEVGLDGNSGKEGSSSEGGKAKENFSPPYQVILLPSTSGLFHFYNHCS